MIRDFEIPKCPEFKLNQKYKKSLKKHNPMEEYSIKIYKIDPYFYEHHEKKKKQVDKNVDKYILSRTDVYFNKFLLVVEIDKKRYTDGDIICQEKRQEVLEKKLGCKFIRINTSNAKNGYDLDYESGNIEAFIDKFKNKKIKELEAKIKNSTINQITNNF